MEMAVWLVNDMLYSIVVNVLRPTPFIDSFSMENIIVAVLILFIATGLMEEVISRWLLPEVSLTVF